MSQKNWITIDSKVVEATRLNWWTDQISLYLDMLLTWIKYKEHKSRYDKMRNSII